MPRRILNHDEDLDLDLALANRQERTRFFVGRAMAHQRLSRPVAQLSPRGIYVPQPAPDSRSAIVKMWPAKATTTAAHSRYLTRGKGLDGSDAVLFGSDSQPIDRQAFAARAQDDPHQFRLIVSLVPPVLLDWVTFTQLFMRQVSHDVRSSLDWLGAVHEDRSVRHVHVQLRARLDDGTPLYFTKDYWTQGLRFRAQQLATQFLGRLSSSQVAREQRLLPAVRAEVTDTRDPAKTRILTRQEVDDRLAETQVRLAHFRAHVQRIAAHQRGRQQGRSEEMR